MKDLSYYINCFSVLHTMKMQEKLAPHKALLLLSVIDLVERGVITDSRIPLSDILEEQFKHNTVLHLGDSTTYDPKINYPYYHMRSEPFWELVSTTANPISDISNYSTSNLKKHIAYARIDTELQQLLTNSSARAILRAVLITKYLATPNIIDKENIPPTSKGISPMEIFLQSSLDQRKAMFRKYLESLNKAESTIKQYTQYHIICEPVLEVIKREAGKENLYEVVDLSQIENIYKGCNELAENKSRNNVYSASVSNYKNFIVFLGTNEAYRLYNNIETMPIEQDYPFSINSIIEYINKTGLLYSPSLIKRFAFSLMAKRFLILSGLAGSGKTQLALAFAKALVQDKEKQMCAVSVGADWTNREPLLGYPNALKAGEYIKPENGVLDLLIEANKPENASKPFFLILDEMNMSYVERYFADFLSAMESHEPVALWKDCNNESDSCGNYVPEKIGLPDNLFIIGTINVDETTYMFSPKVLDRANVIEFKISIDEMTEFLDGIRQVDCSSICSKAAGMGADFVKLANSKEFGGEQVATDTLKAFFTELKNVNAEFGYRSATEIFRFISQARKNDDTAEKMSETEILDAAILQKLLPKLHGSRKKLEPALKRLWKLCFEPSVKDTMQITRENIDKAVYKESADKIYRMYESANANGFTSFAEA